MRKPYILAIDDDVSVLRAVERDLRKRYAENYRVVRAESGASALGVLRQLQLRNEPVALLLVDQRTTRSLASSELRLKSSDPRYLATTLCLGG